MTLPANLRALLVATAFAAVGGCDSDDSTNASASGAGSGGASASSASGAVTSSASGGPTTTECFDWPAQGGAGGAGGAGGGGAPAVPPCPEGVDALMHLTPHGPCNTYTCIGLDAGQCCYEIAPWASCPSNAFPSFEACP